MHPTNKITHNMKNTHPHKDTNANVIDRENSGTERIVAT